MSKRSLDGTAADVRRPGADSPRAPELRIVRRRAIDLDPELAALVRPRAPDAPPATRLAWSVWMYGPSLALAAAGLAAIAFFALSR